MSLWGDRHIGVRHCNFAVLLDIGLDITRRAVFGPSYRPAAFPDSERTRLFVAVRAWSRLFGHNGRVAFGRAAGTEIPSRGG
jgi:hypothetical protein